MNFHNIDWAAVVAAIVALINAFQHRNLAAKVDENHRETLNSVRGGGVAFPPAPRGGGGR